jgi:GEVED domain
MRTYHVRKIKLSIGASIIRCLATYLFLLLAHSLFAQCPPPIYFKSGETFSLAVPNTFNNVQWQVDNGSGFTNIVGATGYSYTVNQPGTYRYLANNAVGCTTGECCPAVFKLCPNPATYALCTGETYTLTAQSGITNIQWQKDTGTGYANIAGATSTTYTVTTIGKYRYIAKDANGCAMELCCPFEIIQGTGCCPAPVTYALCTGETYTLTAQSGINNIQWQKDTGTGYINIAGATSTTYTVTTIGKYRYTAKDANGCTMELCCPFEIIQGTGCCPSPVTYALCTGETYTLTAQSGITNIQWQKDTGTGYANIAGATSTTYTVTTIGKYRYTAKDANGCVITQCCVFDIIQGTGCCPSPVTYALCAGESYTLTTQSGVTNVQWQKNAGTGYIDIAGATNATYIATTIGQYKYTAKDANGCVITQCCVFNIIQGTGCCPAMNYELCAGESYTLTAAQSGITNIQWQKDTGAGYTNIAGATNLTYIATTIGKYRYTAKDANGCAVTQCCIFDIIAGTCLIVTFDRGDLPDATANTTADDYQTTMANNGPAHQIIPGLKLGATIDGEPDGQPTATANGDGADEDGIQGLTATTQFTANTTVRLPLFVTNLTGNIAYLSAWIDWNGDGDFADVGEQVVNLNDTTPFPANLTINIPATAQQGRALGFRVRLSNTNNMTPYGLVNSGEVEDYLMTIKCPTAVCLPMTFTKN